MSNPLDNSKERGVCIMRECVGIAEKVETSGQQNFVTTKNTKPNKAVAFAVHVLARRVLNCSHRHY